MQITSTHQALQDFVWAVSYGNFDDVNMVTAEQLFLPLEKIVKTQNRKFLMFCFKIGCCSSMCKIKINYTCATVFYRELLRTHLLCFKIITTYGNLFSRGLYGTPDDRNRDDSSSKCRQRS